MEALIKQLDTRDWLFNYQMDNESHLSHPFVAYHQAVHLFESRSDVLMADCTYRTNRFKMP